VEHSRYCRWTAGPRSVLERKTSRCQECMPQRTDGVFTHTGVCPTYYCFGLPDDGSLPLRALKVFFPFAKSLSVFSPASSHIFVSCHDGQKPTNDSFSATYRSFKDAAYRDHTDSLKVMFTLLRAAGDGNSRQLPLPVNQTHRCGAQRVRPLYILLSLRLSKLSHTIDSLQIYPNQQRRARPRLRIRL